MNTFISLQKLIHWKFKRKRSEKFFPKIISKSLPERYFFENGGRTYLLNKFGLSAVVALNRFPTDSEKEIEKVQKVCSENGVNAILAEHWADGGKGASRLAETVIENIESKKLIVKKKEAKKNKKDIKKKKTKKKLRTLWVRRKKKLN